MLPHVPLGGARTTESNAPTDLVVASGALAPIVASLARSDMPRAQYEAEWCLTNIASGTAAQTFALVQQGAVPALAGALGSPYEQVREQAIWAFANIAGDSPALRDAVLAQPGVLAGICDAARAAKSVSAQRTVAWALHTLCRGVPAPAFAAVRGALPVLAMLMHSNDADVLLDAGRALVCVLTDRTADGLLAERVGAVVGTGVARRCAELLNFPAPLIQQVAVRVLGRITAGNDSHTQTVINVGALPALLALLSSPSSAIRQEVCWVVSNIAAGRTEQVEALVEAGFVPQLLSLAATSGEPEVKREAAYAVANACCVRSVALVQQLAGRGCLDALCGLLTVTDTRLLAAVLEALDNVFRAGEYPVPGCDDADDNPYILAAEEQGAEALIEQIAENHTDAEVYSAAERLLSRFNADDDDDDFFDEDDEMDDDKEEARLGGADEEEEDDDECDVVTVPDMPSAAPVSLFQTASTTFRPV